MSYCSKLKSKQSCPDRSLSRHRRSSPPRHRCFYHHCHCRPSIAPPSSSPSSPPPPIFLHAAITPITAAAADRHPFRCAPSLSSSYQRRHPHHLSVVVIPQPLFFSPSSNQRRASLFHLWPSVSPPMSSSPLDDHSLHAADHWISPHLRLLYNVASPSYHTTAGLLQVQAVHALDLSTTSPPPKLSLLPLQTPQPLLLTPCDKSTPFISSGSPASTSAFLASSYPPF